MSSTVTPTRINLDHNINRIVKIGASLSYTYKSNDKRNGGVYNQAQKMTTITHAYLNDGSINATPNPWYANFTAHLCSTRMALTSAISRAAVSSAVVICRLNPIKGLIVKSQFTLDRSTSRTGTYQDYHSQARYQSPTTTYIANDRSTGTKYVWQNTANYNKTIAKHDMTFLLGHEMSQYVSESSSISGVAGSESLQEERLLRCQQDSVTSCKHRLHQEALCFHSLPVPTTHTMASTCCRHRFVPMVLQYSPKVTSGVTSHQ